MDTTAFVALNGTLILAVIILVSRKYGTLLNPVSFSGGYFFIATVLSPPLFLHLRLFTSSKQAINHAVLLSSLYFATLGATFLLTLSPLRKPLEAIVNISRPFTMGSRRDLTALASALLALQFVALYITLMMTSGVGLMWLTNTREAYQHHRQGVGVWWSLSQATLMLLFLATLCRRAGTRLKVFFYTIVFSTLAMFLGSKASALAYPVLAAVYIHYCISRIRTLTLVLDSMALVALFIAFQLIQGTAATLLNAFTYFDYFGTSAAFLDRFHQFGFRYGAVTLSYVWFYVPRALYSGKPFTYGPNVILTWIYPGFESVARRTGFTPGMLPWAVGYADFGVIGVMAAGAITAWIAKAVFEYFLDNRDFLSFVLMAQVGFIFFVELFPNAPFPIFWLWFMAEGLMFWTLRSLEPAKLIIAAGDGSAVTR